MPEKYRCNIVGWNHHPGARDRMRSMKENDLLRIRRDPTNPHDRNAIRVETVDDKMMLGFIPAVQAREIAPRLDKRKIDHCLVTFHAGSSVWSVSLEV